LLLVLNELKTIGGYRLHVAHFNHCLRGEASEQDAEYVRLLAKRLGLPCTIEAGDVRTLANQRKLGMEEAARVARYGFFARLSNSLGAAAVAVAHTVDDQVETVVMRILRGTGLAGLRGMLPVTTIGKGQGPFGDLPHDLTVVRPLLDVSRQEIEKYLRDHSITAREDLSNLDQRFLRNRLRSEVIPFLEQYNPQFRGAITRLAESAAEDYAFIQAQLLSQWPSMTSLKDNAVVFDLPAWLGLPASLRRYSLRYAAEKLLGDALDITAEHLKAAAEAMEQRPVGTTIEWPRELRVVKDYNVFQVRKGDLEPTSRIVGMHPLNVPGETAIAGTSLRVIAQITDARGGKVDGNRWHADLDFDVTGPVLFVRRRQEGDTIRPLGLNGEKKLQDLLVDQKVPRQKRDAVPVVVSPDSIVWVAGVRIDERYKVTSSTTRVLSMTIVGYN
jgi:tRNA(Ile)-lysidine synthase